MSELFKRGARPAMGWVGIPLIPFAVIYQGVGPDKLGLLLAFMGAVYGIRAWEKMKANVK